MAEIVMMKLTKHFPPNTAGEICSFTPPTAEHILKHAGGKELARFNTETHYFDQDSMRARPLQVEKKTEKAA